jgi:hypothetical protein
MTTPAHFSYQFHLVFATLKPKIRLHTKDQSHAGFVPVLVPCTRTGIKSRGRQSIHKYAYRVTIHQCMTSVAVSRSRPRAAAGREFDRVRPVCFGPGRSRPGRYLTITSAAGCGQRRLERSKRWIVYDM